MADLPAAELDLAWIREHCHARFAGHINAGDRHYLTHELVDDESGEPLGITRQLISYRRSKRNGDRGGTSEAHWIVDGAGEFPALEPAVVALNRLRCGAEGLVDA